MTTNHADKSAAFTLLEVLAALAVAAIGLLTLIQLHLTTIRLTEATVGRIQAAALAETRLAALTDTDATPSDPPLAGSEIVQGRCYQWTIALAPCPPETLAGLTAAGLRQATIAVTWPQTSGTGSLTLARTFRRPEGDTP